MKTPQSKRYPIAILTIASLVNVPLAHAAKRTVASTPAPPVVVATVVKPVVSPVPINEN